MKKLKRLHTVNRRGRSAHAIALPAHTNNQVQIGREMLIQLNSNHHIKISSADAEEMEQAIRDRLGRFADWLTRVEVHLSNQDGSKSDETDARCSLEVRPEGRDPVITTADAPDQLASVNAALRSMMTVLERERGRLTSRKGH